MTNEEFWAATPRELAARTAVQESQREFLASMHAGIQATLHNAHFRQKTTDPVYEAAMFMPGWKPQPEQPKPDESWKAHVEHMRSTHRRTPEVIQMEAEGQQVYAARMARALQEQAAGASRERVMAIIDGKE